MTTRFISGCFSIVVVHGIVAPATPVRFREAANFCLLANCGQHTRNSTFYSEHIITKFQSGQTRMEEPPRASVSPSIVHRKSSHFSVTSQTAISCEWQRDIKSNPQISQEISNIRGVHQMVLHVHAIWEYIKYTNDTLLINFTKLKTNTYGIQRDYMTSNAKHMQPIHSIHHPILLQLTTKNFWKQMYFATNICLTPDQTRFR